MSTALPDWLKEIYPFEPKRFETGAGAMSYLDEGTGDEAVVMVHGNPTWSFFYRDVVRSMRGRMRCIVPDHLGCGLSDKPQDYDYTLPNHIKNLAALLESLHLRRVHLIVHDWGGPIGLGATLPLGERLGRLVLLNTAAFADTVIPARISLCRIPGLGKILVRGLNGFAGPASWMSVTKPLPPAVKRGFLFPYDSWANRVAVHCFVQDIPTGRGSASDRALAEIERQLPLLKNKPVQIVWGGRDFCFNRHYFERWTELLPKAQAVYLPAAGHYVLEDGGEEAVRQIATHLMT
jgi:haloalkane dehalogenase